MGKYDALYDEPQTDESSAPSGKYSALYDEGEQEQSLTPETDKAMEALLAPPRKAPPPTPSRITWNDPGAASAALSGIPGRLKDLWDKHVTWGDTTAAKEEQDLAKLYPEKTKEEIYQTGKKAIFDTSLLPAKYNPIHIYGEGIGAIAPHLGPLRGAAEVASGVYKGIGEAESKFITPGNVAISALAPEGKIAEAALGGTFLGQAIAGTPAAWKALKESYDKRDWAKVSEIATSMGASYLPGLGILGLAGMKQPLKPEPKTIEAEPPMKMSAAQFTEASQLRLNELESKQQLDPVEQAEKDLLTEHLSEGGDINKLAPQVGIQIAEPQPPQTIKAKIGGESDAIQPSDAQVQTGDAAQRVEARPGGEVPETGSSDYAVGAPSGEETRGDIPGEEPIPTGESVAAAPPSQPDEPGTELTEEEVTPLEEKTQEIQGQEAGVLEPLPESVAATEEVAEPEAAAPAKFKKQQPAFDDFANSPAHPVSFAVHDMGGILSKSQAIARGKYKGNEALWDVAAPFAHPTHNKIYDPNGQMPDVVASNLHDEGLLSDGYVDNLWEALQKESKAARSEHKQQTDFNKEVKLAEEQNKDFLSAQEKFYKSHASQSKVTPSVEWKDMGIGDKIVVDGTELTVKDIDPDDLTVILDGGKRFGIQEVREGGSIFGEHKPAPREDLEFAPPESDQEMLARQKEEGKKNAELESEAEKKAQVKTGWQQKKTGDTGDLGQMSIEGVGDQDLFNQGQKLRLKSEKEGGYVNAEIMKEAMDYGRKLYGKAKDFTSWAGEMVRNLGSAIRGHLQGIWRSITGQNILPHARERGSVPLPQRKKGEGPRNPQERQLDVFKAEAKQKGISPTAKMYEYWKKHLESLPEQGETLQQHEARTPEMEVSKANYDHALANNQIMAASQIKRAALKRGINFDAPPPARAGKTPKVAESAPNEITVKDAKTGKTNSFVLPPERIPQQINAHLQKGDTILAAPKGSLQAAGKLIRDGIPPSQKPGGIDKWEPEKDDALPKVDDNNGSQKPPPPGSSFGPTYGPMDPGKEWLSRVNTKMRDYWENFWPRDRKMLEETGERGARFIIAHQHFLDRARDNFLDVVNDPAYKVMQDMKHDVDSIVDAEDWVISDYQELLDQGLHPDAAWEEAVLKSPLKEVFQHRKRMEPAESEAADMLGVTRPKKVDDPYLARTTNEEGKAIERLGWTEPNLSGQLRKSIGMFDNSRAKRTMKTGIADGVQYNSPVYSFLQREKVGAMLRATAHTVQELLDSEAMFEKKEAAMAASKDGKTAYQISGLGGRDYWVANRQEAVFMRHNFSNNTSFNNPISRLSQLMNLYVRNPNLINPLPHITKNMFFKQMLAQLNNATMKKDLQAFYDYSEPELIEKFGETMGWPKSHLRVPQLMSRGMEGVWMERKAPEGTGARRTQEAALWMEHAGKKALRLNEFSQKYIFQKADPAMRYAVWKSYVRKGMSPVEAAGHTWIDLVRYDANSGGLNLWKSLPLNFFSAWRTGAYVTLFKALKTHPLSTIAIIGALEYMRESVLRKTLTWTHLPIDYLEAPLAEAIDAFHQAHSAVQLGKNPIKAYAGAAADTAKITATIAAFGPGGAQAPDSIVKFVQAMFMHGTAADRARAQNMFWGVSQIVNQPQEFMAAMRDGKWAEHMTKAFANFTLGTHSAIQYEPRRLGAFIPESFPGMGKSEDYKRAEALRNRRDTRALKAQNTFEQRHGVTRGFYQGPEDQQWGNLLRGAGAARTKKATTYPGH